MSKLAQQFSDFRKSTPKHIQWLLMAAAFIVIVVLIILLASGKKKTPTIEVIGEETENVNPELVFEPKDAKFDWKTTAVEQTQTGTLEVRANTSVKVTDVKVSIKNSKSEEVGISALETCSNDQTILNQDVSCTITLTYEPTKVLNTMDGEIIVSWYPWGDEEQKNTTKAATIILGAQAKPVSETKEAPKQEKQEIEEDTVEELEPLPAPKTTQPKQEVAPTVQETDEEPEEEEDVADEETEEEQDLAEAVEEDVNTLAPEIDFDEVPLPAAPKPSAKPVPVTTSAKKISLGNACSDFAFPGYNLQGIQSGWIKPESGAYYYHPYSDKNCDTPTGKYNAESGYIMDIEDPTKKIGSDAEHIRVSIQDRMPALSNRPSTRTVNKARQKEGSGDELDGNGDEDGIHHLEMKESRVKRDFVGSDESNTVFNSKPYDRTFLLRQYKPIPATIVSDIQADPELLNSGIPVRATVDRNVYSDNGRTVIIPTGTMMLGYVTGNLPGPYKAIGRLQIQWYQFIRPDGTEFNFSEGSEPFSADAQGRKGVPGHGSTDYLQQFVMPMLTAIVPAAVNMIAPIADRFVNQIDLDNNTVVQSGTVRSSELAKNEIISAWNTVATKLMVDMMDNTTPPFSIAAGTRITVFSPVDLGITCGDPDGDGETRKCAIHSFDEKGRNTKTHDATYDESKTEEFVGQVRAMMYQSLAEEYCEEDPKTKVHRARQGLSQEDLKKAGMNFTTLDFYCRSMGTYDAINNAKQQVLFENQQDKYETKVGGAKGSQEYNENVLGLTYDEEGIIKNPFEKVKPVAPEEEIDPALTCEGGISPDANGCCPGETFTDMGAAGMNCCPDAGGDCFPPITK